ncbi:hypothetical protein NP493_242g01000 [Ridgeia piscesae]|uniref:Uncharacterized protein n=1 Tax=Ridgeia piscesae TaxID=27915 RepID=A0AAD9NYR7_RIDPI|nr:hypothetical protein NP493_242g01000 [Ridgeia piscesae]
MISVQNKSQLVCFVRPRDRFAARIRGPFLRNLSCRCVQRPRKCDQYTTK